ncbi:MAG: hypothetical protein ACMG6E_04325 [Candidatus Roizmanbacteria bacterium]
MDVIANIFESYALLFVQALKGGNYSASFLETMKSLFEYDSMLHAYNY